MSAADVGAQVQAWALAAAGQQARYEKEGHAVADTAGETGDWLAAALARQAEFRADEAAFAAKVNLAAGKVAEQISALLPDGYSFGRESAPVTLQSVADLLGQIPVPRRVTLHCHQDVLDALNDHAEAAGADRAQLANRICGIDIFTEDDLGPGEWELREHGQVIDSGKIRTLEEWAREFFGKVGRGEITHDDAPSMLSHLRARRT